MKSKWLFWILVVFVFGTFIAVGFLFFKDESKAFWIIEGIALVVILFFIVLYRRLIKPYQIILSGIELLNAQDFSSRLRPVQNNEANRLIEVFNRMMAQLKNERLLVREKNQFLDLLIQASPQGVIILDFDNRISEINPAGLQLLDISDISEVKGKTFAESTFDLAPSLASLQPGDDIVIRSFGMSVYRCVRSSFIDRGFDHPFILVEELTHELLRVEKESYENIIRMMSHEVNNSVGAIGSTLNVVADILRMDGKSQWDDVLPAIDASFDRCGHLAHFISNLARVIRIPEPSFSNISLNELARSVDALTRIECQKRNIKLVLQLSPEDQMVRVDGIQFEQVLVNIVKNAYESIEENGEIRIATSIFPLSVSIEDNGPGITEETKQKLFTPFFTTKSTGQGIGLMFVRDVLINHHCKFTLSTDHGWTRFQILFE